MSPAPEKAIKSAVVENEPTSRTPNLTAFRRWAILAMFASSNFWGFSAQNCIAPFFPGVAMKQKALTQFEVGIIFGSFNFVVCLTSPLLGKLISTTGSKQMYLIGLTCASVSSLLLGFLTSLPSGSAFFAGGVALRCLQGLGDAADLTALCALCSYCFPDNFVFVVSALEVFVGLGEMAGPLIGGFLFEYGGFGMPFFVHGAALLLTLVGSVFLLPAVKDGGANEKKGDDGERSPWLLLKVPFFTTLLLGMIISALSILFLDQALEGHLSPLGLSSSTLGLVLVSRGVAYCMFTPLVGWCIDRWNCSKWILHSGSLASFLALSLIGPSPYIPMQLGILPIGIAIFLTGYAAAAQYFPIFKMSFATAFASGMSENTVSVGIVSGIIHAAWNLGSFIGPAAGSLSMQYFGFEWTATIIGYLYILLVTDRVCASDARVADCNLSAGRQVLSGAL